MEKQLYNNTASQRKHSRGKTAAAAVMASALALSATGATLALPTTGAYADDGTVATVESEAVSTTFTFSDSGITASGDTANYSIDGTDLTITASGTYEVTGSCADGSISVKKGVQDVTIILNGLTLSNDGDKAIKFKQGASGTIVIKGENTLSTTNDKGIIKANAVEAEEDVLEYDESGHTTGGDLVISGDGTLNLSSTYSEVVDGETEGCDAINCEGDLTVLSGTFNISVTDDGMHSDNTLTIGAAGTAGPVINIAKAEEGLEGATVNLLSGTGDINTADDGINAANKDLVAYNWQYAVNVAGGTWKVVAAGDGIDSNGDLTVSGGSTEVWCTGSGNGAVDYGEGMEEGEVRGSFTYTGGEMLAVGSDMLVVPSSGEFVLFGGGQGAGQGAGQDAGQPGQGDTPPAMPNGQQPPQSQGGQAPMQPQQDENDQDGVQMEQEAGPQDAGQPGGQMPGGQAPGDMAQGGTTLLSAGEDFYITDGTDTLYSGTAAADGRYVLFMSDELDSSKTYTLVSGNISVSAAVGDTSGGTAVTDDGTQSDGTESAAAQAAPESGSEADASIASEKVDGNASSTKQSSSTDSIPKTGDAAGAIGISALAAGLLATSVFLVKRKF